MYRYVESSVMCNVSHIHKLVHAQPQQCHTCVVDLLYAGLLKLTHACPISCNYDNDNSYLPYI